MKSYRLHGALLAFVLACCGASSIESDVTVSFSLETLDDRPDDFRTDKFNRLTQTRWFK